VWVLQSNGELDGNKNGNSGIGCCNGKCFKEMDNLQGRLVIRL
jgi:hypothetical protein